EHVTLTRFEPGDQCVVLATHDAAGEARLTVGERLSLAGDSLPARVPDHGTPARIDDYVGVDGPVAARLRGLGIRSGVGSLVTVGGERRGTLIVVSARQDPRPAETEDRISDFADLVATAIGNAETRA